MFRTIVAGYERTEHGRDALALGRVLAETTGAELVVAGVVPVEAPYAEGQLADRLARRSREAEQKLLEELAEVAESAGARGEAVPGGSAAEGLYELSEELNADAVVVGSTDRGAVGRVLVGSTGERLLHGAPCAVAVAPREYHGAQSMRTIGVGYDRSPESHLALRRTIEIAARANARVRILSVVSWEEVSAVREVAPELEERHHRLYRRWLDEALERVPQKLRPAGSLLWGEPARRLADEAGKDVDLLVVGSRGYGPIHRTLLGGVAFNLVHSAPCPVLVLPRGVEETKHAGAGP